MNNYYFTFGQNHWHRDGIPMSNYWVRVVAESYDKAREIFIQRFTSVYMQDPMKFAFQYEENKFKPNYFPKGEFLLIEQCK